MGRVCKNCLFNLCNISVNVTVFQNKRFIKKQKQNPKCAEYSYLKSCKEDTEKHTFLLICLLVCFKYLL